MGPVGKARGVRQAAVCAGTWRRQRPRNLRGHSLARPGRSLPASRAGDPGASAPSATQQQPTNQKLGVWAGAKARGPPLRHTGALELDRG